MSTGGPFAPSSGRTKQLHWLATGEKGIKNCDDYFGMLLRKRFSDLRKGGIIMKVVIQGVYCKIIMPQNLLLLTGLTLEAKDLICHCMISERDNNFTMLRLVRAGLH